MKDNIIDLMHKKNENAIANYFEQERLKRENALKNKSLSFLEDDFED